MAVTEITHTFEYAIPDKYLYQTNDLGLTTTFTYTGPARIWLVVDKKTNRVLPSDGWVADDGDPTTHEQQELQAGKDAYPVLVDARVDPVIASAFVMNIDQADYPQTEFTREQHDPSDNTVYYSRAANPTPDHTYEIGEITYNPEAQQFNKPYPWKKPHMTWDELWEGRDGIIANVQQSITDLEGDNPDGQHDELLAECREFITEMNALEEKFPSTHWDPWMIPFPDDPRINTEEIENATQIAEDQ